MRWWLVGVLAAVPALGAEYFVSNRGDDAADGLAPERAWATLRRVNAAELRPGDTIRFQRGGAWRGQLIPQSGDDGASITYTDYGEGDKPKLIGSLAADDPAAWRDLGDGLWETLPPQPTDRTVLPADSARHLSVYAENGAQAGGAWTDAGFAVTCRAAGKRSSDIQVIISPFAVQADQVYELRYEVSATAPFPLPAPKLMQANAPWESYAYGDDQAPTDPIADRREVRQVYHARLDASDARLTFFVGDRMPAGAMMTIRGLTMVACEGGLRLPADIGNIILDGGRVCGIKKWDLDQATGDLTYWYDRARHTVRLRSDRNPAERFAGVELAVDRHVIQETGRHHVTYENLDISRGAAHGIGGGGTHHITVRGCDISWIGGGELGERVRFGNGVEFWAGAHDNLVERCRLWEIYDAALTNQNQGSVVEQINITYRDNVIWNSEYSFEYWNRPAESVSRNIVFEHNSCYNAGGGWGHAQRPDPNGRHLCFYSSDADTKGLVIRGNIFHTATNMPFEARWWPIEQIRDPAVLRLERNVWYQPTGELAYLGQQRYGAGDFERYRGETGQDDDSLNVDPRFLDPAAGDLRLREGSPAAGFGAR